MSREYWKIEEDLCRCCHSEGTFKNLAGAYNFGEEEEIYFNMLRDTLDINIAPASGVLCVPTYTICDVCILRLRDATTFKKQVLHCEQKFKHMYGSNFIKLAEPDYSVEVKDEVPEEDSKQEPQSLREDDDDDSFDRNDDGDHEPYDEEFSTKRIKEEGKKKSKKTPQKAKPKSKPKKPPKKPGRPRKVKDIKEEGAPEDQEKTEDASFRPVSSKLEQLLTEDGSPQSRLQLLSIIEDGPTKQYFCRNCDVTFSEIDLAQSHIETVHTNLEGSNHIKVYKCTEVGQDFNIRLDNMESYTCTDCCKSYPSKNSLEIHYKNYHKLKKCPDCNLEFTVRNLRMHQHEVHAAQIPTCGICGYKSWVRSKVTLHQRKVHMNEKNVSCDQCDMRFFDRINLERHKIAHSNERKFECSYCHKRYPRLNTLRLHEKIHTKMKDKVCSLCGKGFVQKASLNYHMKKHHPEAC